MAALVIVGVVLAVMVVGVGIRVGIYHRRLQRSPHREQILRMMQEARTFDALSVEKRQAERDMYRMYRDTAVMLLKESRR